MSYIIPRRLRVERVLRRQHGGGDHDAEQDDVAEVGVVAEPVALLPKNIKKSKIKIKNKKIKSSASAGWSARR